MHLQTATPQTPPADARRDRITEVDLLRFLAALAVLFYHYGFRGAVGGEMTTMAYPLLAPVAKYGYLGVHLFFIISGFVILRTAARGDFKHFLVSRIVRLYPAFWVCCTLTFVLSLTIGGSRYPVSFGQYLANMTLLSGFFGIRSIDDVYWSLFVEIQFYAMVAGVIALRLIDRAQGFLLAWLAATLMLERFPSDTLRVLLIADFSPYFIAGAIFYLIRSKGLTLVRAAMLLAAWVLATTKTIRRLPFFEGRYQAEMSEVVVAGLITSFFVAMLLISLRCTPGLKHRIWLGLGALTYPLYLLHENIGFMIFNLAYPAMNPHVVFWGTTFAILGAAWAVHRLIEKPFSPRFRQALLGLFPSSSR